jgi:hypothetical protein
LHVGALAKASRHVIERLRKIADLIAPRDLELKIQIAGGNFPRSLYE